MSQTIQNSDLLKKIKALYDKAESAKELGSEIEAIAFLSKVEELINKHRISMNDVLNYSDTEEIGHSEERANGVEYFLKEFQSEAQVWETQLMQVICDNNFVYLYWKSYEDNTYMSEKAIAPYMVLVATPSNVEICKYLFEIARNIFRKLAAKKYEEVVKAFRVKYAVEADSNLNAYRQFCSYIKNRIKIIKDRKNGNEFYKIFKHLNMESQNSLLPDDFLIEKIHNQIIYPVDGSFKPIKLDGDDFMPSSYKESDKDKFQTYYIKNLQKFNIMVDRGTFIRSFLLGVSIGVQKQLEKNIRQFDKEIIEEDKKITSLIKKSNQDLKEYVNNKVGKINNVTQSKPADRLGFSSGIEAGKNTHLGSGIGGGKGATKQLN